MGALLLGLVLFLGMHSARIVADDARTRFIAQRGEGLWKGLYTLVSALGLALIVWGYGQARAHPTPLWTSPVWARHLALALTLVAFVLLAAAYVPRNGIKARLHHPMVLGVKTWALAHLLANNTLADVLLFGGFLAWAVLSFRAARARDRAAATVYGAGSTSGTATAVVVGVVAWAAFTFWGHAALIGVKPF
ncbi:MAG: NnrU family protein [Burkholderiaceae bacterium]